MGNPGTNKFSKRALQMRVSHKVTAKGGISAQMKQNMKAVRHTRVLR